jgi:hypothetical protein
VSETREEEGENRRDERRARARARPLWSVHRG